jgi:ubiquinone/menaquinone biosynthesis C-methylase UbiE
MSDEYDAAKIGTGQEPSVVTYDLELVPWLFEHWAEPMVDLVDPRPSSRIVDLACGSGLIVRHLQGRLDGSGRIHGVDFDAAMLAYAATTVEDDRVTWHESDVADLPFETNSLDRVSCHQGLQFFPDRPTALAEARRVLEPDGRLGVATWGRLADNPWPAALSSAVGRLLGERAGAGMAIVCDLGEPGELAAILREANFAEIVVQVQDRTVTHPDVRVAVAGQVSALPSGSAIAALTSEQREQLVDLMCEELADHTDATGRLRLPSTSNLAHARAADG